MYDNFIPQHGILRLVTRVGGFTFIGSTGTLLTGTVWATALISILHFRWNKLYLLIPVMRHYVYQYKYNHWRSTNTYYRYLEGHYDKDKGN